MTTTISREQHAYATRRAAEAGPSDRVTVLCEDYRDLTGRYDKLVSIDLRQVHLEDITAPYATTLAAWRERFLAARDQLAVLGYDERFRRLWERYLCYCEGGFAERRIQNVQLLLAKPGDRAEPLSGVAQPAAS